MRLTTLCTVTLALSLCGTAAAQVGTLVRHDTSNDPCEKFRMRVLMPADASPRPRPESPVNSPDPGMVWNPCRVEQIQIATVPITVTPGEAPSPTVPPFKLQPPTPSNEQPAILSVQLPPAFEMMKRRQ